MDRHTIQQLRPDRFFTAEQQRRLAELLQRWRTGRARHTPLPPGEQTELEGLVEAELRGAAERAVVMSRGLTP
jgi:hypothetical protein